MSSAAPLDAIVIGSGLGGLTAAAAFGLTDSVGPIATDIIFTKRIAP